MAAKNGSIKTVLWVVFLFLALCAVGFYILFFAGNTSHVFLDPENTLHSSNYGGFHDHRL